MEQCQFQPVFLKYNYRYGKFGYHCAVMYVGCRIRPWPLHVPGEKVVLGIFMASITIPLTFTIIPIYELLNGLHMTNSLLGLIIAECGGSHILFLMLFSSFYTSIPNEMEEAAIVDGCGFCRRILKSCFLWESR